MKNGRIDKLKEWDRIGREGGGGGGGGGDGGGGRGWGWGGFGVMQLIVNNGGDWNFRLKKKNSK